MREAKGGVAAAALHQEEGAMTEMRQTNEQHHQGRTEEDEGQESRNLTRGAERGTGGQTRVPKYSQIEVISTSSTAQQDKSNGQPSCLG